MNGIIILVFVCLVASKDVGERIVGGQIAKPHQIPHQAALLIKKTSVGAILCGGSLISADAILTAAHCLHGTEGQIAVILGNVDLYPTNGTWVHQLVNSSYFRIHPQFNNNFAYLDIAVVLLSTPLTFSLSVQPVKLPSGFLFEESYSGEIGTVSGFGQICDNCDASQLLRFTLNRVMGNDECAKEINFNAVPSDTQICLATRETGSGGCRGDSGGPLTIVRNGTVTQIGISSFGHHKCEEGSPAIYTRLTKELVTWALEQIKKD